MTSNTEPNGEVIGDNHGTNYAYYAFDKNNSTNWSGKLSTGINYVGYKFDIPMKILKASFYPRIRLSNNTIKEYKLQASNDNGNWVDLYGEILNNIDYGIFTRNINNNQYYKYFRVLVLSTYDSEETYCQFIELQFYGRTKN